jgi:hypothetical protein
MKDNLLHLANYLLNALGSALIQLIILFGPVILFSLLLHMLAGLNEKLSYRVMGRRLYLLIFGWLGISIHELGHAFFALLFGHTITEMKLFTPSASDGTLGYVKHSYNKNSVYQTIGNFFIGLGPIILGSVLLYLISFILFAYKPANLPDMPAASGSLLNRDWLISFVTVNLKGFSGYLQQIFTAPGTVWWKIVLHLYLLYAIGSSIKLSPEDMKTAGRGFFLIIILLVLFNIATLWYGDFTIHSFRKASALLSDLYMLMALAIMINLAFTLILGLCRLILPSFSDYWK